MNLSRNYIIPKLETINIQKHVNLIYKYHVNITTSCVMVNRSETDVEYS